MAHYIDADRLRAELEKRLKNVRDYMNGAGMRYKGPKYYKAQGKESAYDALLNIIDSLQQEQTDFPITDEQIKEFLATHPKIEVPEKYKNPDWLFKKQEQSEVDLEKFISDFIDKKDSENQGKWCEEDIIEAMKSSHALGKLNARKEENK